MKLTTPQLAISKDPARFRTVVAGRRFGKTYLAINELAKFARHPHQRCLYIATTYRQAKNVVWNDLIQMLTERNWVKKINQSDLEITLVNGSIIALRSSDNKEALRGTKWNFIVFDEFASMDPETFNSVLRPTLSDTQGHALFIGTPYGRNHFWEMYNNAVHLEDWSSHQYTTIAGGNVIPEEIEAAKRDLDERTFNQEYNATFEDARGIIAYAYSQDNLKKAPELTPSNALMIGIDFNTDNFAACVMLQNRDTLHVIDEIMLQGSSTQDMCKEIQSRYGKRMIIVFPDASGSQRKTSANGMTDHLILHNSGFKVRTPKMNPPVKDAIAAVNSRLRNTNGEVKLYIDPKCRHTIDSLTKYTYKEGTRTPDKTGAYDGMFDALKYAVWQLFPLQQTNFNTTSTNRFRNAGVRPR
jgi:phage terminase large subunit